MKKNLKKEIFKITPICVLSMGLIVGVGTPASADVSDASKINMIETVKYTLPKTTLASDAYSQLAWDVVTALQSAIKNEPHLFGYITSDRFEPGVHHSITPIDQITNPYDRNLVNDFYNHGHPLLGMENKQLEFAGINNNISVTGAQDGDTADLANLELLNYHNGGNVEQTYNTVEKQYSTTDSMTYTNHEGVKLGISEAIKATAGVPLVVKGEETTTLSAEFTYDHTSANTSSKTTTYTFKSQPVKCVPHGTTKFIQSVKQAKFSGTYTGPVRVIEPKDLKVQVRNADNYETGFITASPQEESHFLYNAFKYSTQPIPSYIELDDATKNVIIKEPGATMTFTGQAGFQENAKLEFIPDDKSKPSVTIPYSIYMKEQQKGSINKYINELLKKKTR
ncbi:ETX/MTX2 family pore-forming toxin [Bacillus thuringiensis]|uniref:ETX/MTX2 family pore-forming toxin n=1 Tax=Bacillus thuringiensis TaxID=1428 RepID=UPI00148214E8|nr:ETX/MTX2 family pore-forming toxin [Bacillus thuringiensis]